MAVIAIITDNKVLQKILTHLKLPTEPPTPRPARYEPPPGAESPTQVGFARQLARGEHVSEALEALRRIEPAAAEALEPLRASLRARKPAPAQAVALVPARLGTAARVAKPELIASIATLRSELAAQTTLWSARAALEAVVNTLVVVGGPPANGEVPALLDLLRDDRAGIEVRDCAGLALKERAGIGAADRRLAALVEQKSVRRRSLHRSPQPQRVPPRDVVAVQRLGYELTLCQQEAGQPPSTEGELTPSRRLEVRANETMATCLADRICGPDQRAYRSTLSTCCSIAYKSNAPTFCGGR